MRQTTPTVSVMTANIVSSVTMTSHRRFKYLDHFFNGAKTLCNKTV